MSSFTRALSASPPFSPSVKVCGALELLMTVSVSPAGTVTSVAPNELVLVMVTVGPVPMLSAALSLAAMLATVLGVFEPTEVIVKHDENYVAPSGGGVPSQVIDPGTGT